MKIQDNPPLHLTYCLNLHPGEAWAENFAAIQTHVLAIRDRVAPGGPFGLGLRLGDRAARELAPATRLAELRDFLAAHGLYAFTVNGFPYGAFHGTAVKENVYRPDWRSAERLDYTVRLAEILAALLPEGVAGSISTVPVSYKDWMKSEADLRPAVENLAECAHRLEELYRRTGKDIALALEPEPDC